MRLHVVYHKLTWCLVSWQMLILASVLQLWLFKGKIYMVANFCCWNILLGFRCYHCAWSSKLMEFSGTIGECHLNYWNFIHNSPFYCQIYPSAMVTSLYFCLVASGEYSLGCTSDWWFLPNWRCCSLASTSPILPSPSLSLSGLF